MAHDRAHDAAGGGDAREIDHRLDAMADAIASLERRVRTMADELAALGPKLNELLDRHPAGLGAASDMTAAVASQVAGTALEPVHEHLAGLSASVADQREETQRALDALDRMAAAVDRLDDRTEDRLAAVRDAAMTPVADLQAMLAARGERIDARLDALAATVEQVVQSAPPGDGATVPGAIDELAGSVQSLTSQLPDLAAQLAELRDLSRRSEAAESEAAAGDVGDDVVERVSHHTDLALAGILRLIDTRLDAVRDAVRDAAPPRERAQAGGMGFEAGAVMGAAQAAWNRLEQRLDDEFDDLSRQLQAMAALVERAITSAEAAANRPVVTGEQIRSAASSLRDSVVRASRARRERRGGPRGLGPGEP